MAALGRAVTGDAWTGLLLGQNDLGSNTKLPFSAVWPWVSYLTSLSLKFLHWSKSNNVTYSWLGLG